MQGWRDANLEGAIIWRWDSELSLPSPDLPSSTPLTGHPRHDTTCPFRLHNTGLNTTTPALTLQHGLKTTTQLAGTLSENSWGGGGGQSHQLGHWLK